MSNQRTEIVTGLLILSVLAFGTFEGCAKSKETTNKAPARDETPPGGYFVSPNNVEARLSDQMQKIKGRWIKEIADPNTPNPPTMTLFAVADNTLQGRFFVGGAYADVGVAATLVQEDVNFTLTLTDDELRPHDWVPKVRVFRGTFDAEKNTLELKNEGGEFLRFTFKKEPAYAMTFSANVYRCVVVPTPSPLPTPVASAARSIGLPPNIPRAALNSCGIMVDYEEEWSRMSGAE